MASKKLDETDQGNQQFLAYVVALMRVLTVWSVSIRNPCWRCLAEVRDTHTRIRGAEWRSGLVRSSGTDGLTG